MGLRSWQGTMIAVPYVSPVMALMEIIRSSVAGRGPGPAGASFLWPIHCVLMLLGSTLILMIAARQVRKVALRQVTGQTEAQTTAFEDKVIEKLMLEPSRRTLQRPLRPVHGPPIVWKELAAPLIPGRREKTTIGLAAAVLVLVLLYGVGISQHDLHEDLIQVAYVELFMVLGTLVTILLVSTPITSEKEAGTWPILLATPVTDRDILAGKAIGALKRCTVVWAFLAAHLLLSVALGYVSWIAILQMGILVTGSMAFVCGTGLYLSSRFSRTTPVVVLNAGLVLGLWFVLPSVLASGLVLGHRPWAPYLWLANPFTQASSVIRASCDLAAGTTIDKIRYPMPLAEEGLGFWETTSSLLIVSGISLVVCLILLALANRRLRRDIF
jgi:ABC-type transport system involved in multi-copper enzyme maturation permease subunit